MRYYLLMSLFFGFITILQTFSISLGVGSSTLAILNFFAAIADGSIDETERRMMGIVYVVLRVAMVTILVTTLLLITREFGPGGLTALTAFSFSQLLVLFVLYLNALLMTAHLVPSTFGPAIQAGSWYALGTLSALQIVGVTNFTFLQFLLGYLAWIVLAIGIVNGAMVLMRAKRERAQ